MGRQSKRAGGSARGARSGKDRAQLGSLVRLLTSLLGSQSRQASQGARALAARRLLTRIVQAATEVRKAQDKSQQPEDQLIQVMTGASFPVSTSPTPRQHKQAQQHLCVTTGNAT